MTIRKTTVLKQLITALVNTASSHALYWLENEFKACLLVVAGDLNTVGAHAEQLRAAVTTDECAVVLDHLSVQQVTIEQVEEAINSLFPQRFVEP